MKPISLPASRCRWTAVPACAGARMTTITATNDHAGVSPIRVFWAAWAGWMLDGFDSAAYGLLLVSVLVELLPLSGIEASKANIALYGGYGFSIFMLGWACSMFRCWLAHRIRRGPSICTT